MGDGQFKPGVAAIIIIAIGILIFTLLFIFAKRQIMRLAQKFPTDGPHAPIGYDVPRNLCQKIEHRLNAIKNIHHEPILINPDNKYSCDENVSKYPHIYRMKAMDSIKDLEDYIVNCCNRDETKRKHPDEEIQQYFLKLQNSNGPLAKCDSHIIDQFVNSYYHARCDPEPVFGREEYEHFRQLLDKIKSSIVPMKTKSSLNTATQQPSSSTTLKAVNRKISKTLTSNLSFKNLANLSSSSNASSKEIGPKKPTDETCV